MIISKNTQLGLMFKDSPVKIEFFKNLQKWNIETKRKCEENIKQAEEKLNDLAKQGKDHLNSEEYKEFISGFPMKAHTTKGDELGFDIRAKLDKLCGEYLELAKDENSKYYLITSGVEKPSQMIRIGDNFSSLALKNVNIGKHTYLLGKNEMIRFICAVGGIKGIYWNRTTNIGFDFGFDLVENGYYFPTEFTNEFTRVTQLMTFIELGDIETIILESNKNNGKSKNDGKIHNGSNNTVYVVDSTWNQILIRTEGFGVMGHGRLQPCGKGNLDRKLIWISAFEKHGYTRRPRAEILE